MLILIEIGDENAPKWKKLSSEELGISTSMIAKPTRVVLNGLKKKGMCSKTIFDYLLAILSFGICKWQYLFSWGFMLFFDIKLVQSHKVEKDLFRTNFIKMREFLTFYLL